MQAYLISECFDQFSVLNSLFVIFKQIICHIVFSILEKFTSEITWTLVYEWKKLDFRDCNKQEISEVNFSRIEKTIWQMICLNMTNKLFKTKNWSKHSLIRYACIYDLDKLNFERFFGSFGSFVRRWYHMDPKWLREFIQLKLLNKKGPYFMDFWKIPTLKLWNCHLTKPSVSWFLRLR